MSFPNSLRAHLRYGWKLRSFLSHTISLEEARAIVEENIAGREANFLRIIERSVFGFRRSPYLPLLKLAGCELGDIGNMVRSRGLESTLVALRAAGVYVSFEEFKGRVPIVRNGKLIPIKSQDFDNPHLGEYYRAETGGTTGAASQVAIDLDHLADYAPHMRLTEHAHRIFDTPTAIWYGVLPDGTGLQSVLLGSRFGHIAARWFSPNRSGGVRRQFATRFVVGMARLAGRRIPYPEPLGLERAATLAHWAADTVKAKGACLIRTHVSKALRLCIAARDEGLDLTGTTFFGGGEPPTPAKVRWITQTGARWIPMYWLTEAGCVGQGCARPADDNDVHFFKDGLALIEYPRKVPGLSDLEVDAFHFTTLFSSAPRILLNVESDDYGVVEKRSCGCALESYGFTDHLRDIHSFSKLTAEGVTLVGSEMIRILEEVLPARFGGSPLDYQLAEEEDERGFTRLTLLVSPRVALADEGAAIDAVLQALDRIATDADRSIWRQAQTLRVRRQEPIWTGRGKLMPLHLMKKRN
jgi:hypothetical protein